MPKKTKKPEVATLNAPLQARSQKTLERILRAVERLLETRDFEEITIAEIVRRSRSSIGAFYARFPNKDSLLPVLYDRCTQAIGDKLFAKLHSQPRPKKSLAQTVGWGMDIIVDEFRKHRALLRAIGLYSRTHPQEIRPDQLQDQEEARRPFLDLLLSHRNEIQHPDPEKAVRFGFFATAAACREKILFESPHAAATPASDPELKRELTRMFLGYLGAETPPKTTPAPSGDPPR